MTSILIVDDHQIFRIGLALSLAEAGDLIVCGEASAAGEAVKLFLELTPDLVLLDLSMPGDGHTALAEILEHDPTARVAVLTASEDAEDVRMALRAGAAGYILKGVGSRALIEAVRGLAAGEGYVAPGLAARMIAGNQLSTAAPPSGQGALDARFHTLTPKELQVLRLVAAGHSNKEVAYRSGTQEKTIKRHMTHILQKLQVRNRTEAAVLLHDVETSRRTGL